MSIYSFKEDDDVPAQEIPTVYDPQAVEEKWFKFWLDGGYFTPRIEPEKEPFTIVIPPPNVTGALHMGHALDNTIQDVLIRFHRMQGDPTLWLPGTDHAGIATQARVEAELAKEGLSRWDLGREKFLERVWQWKEQYGGRIIRQLQRLGASCDFTRERFTMDAGCSRAVREVFVSLYERGLIYRGNYIINWCPHCHTAISDIEVEHEDTPGKLWYIRYPLAEGEGYITVATTRPETMLGDTGIAVHPEDERYRHLVGKEAVLPVVGRRLPIFADDYVDPAFGTGAVKVTPSHDPNDFEMGRRHRLEEITVIGLDGKMTEAAGKFAGLDRYACREQLVKELEEGGYLVKIEDLAHAVGHCSRCGTVIEPLLSRQWFVKMKPLAEPALAAVRDGRIRFIPERFTKIYINWLENIRDWCISRQLWWGHRIPVWYCRECGAEAASRTDLTACPCCGSTHIEQDPDVLDTWFSSALWPFSTLGWPEETADLKYFYPTSVLVTGRDIIFFWVARMIFMALAFQDDVPFRNVFIHGLVLDAEGRKMSKSLGNGIDPLEVIEKYGADTLRFMLITASVPGYDLRFHWDKVEATRNFANKVWNVARFALLNLEDFDPAAVNPAELTYTLADRWIRSRFSATRDRVTELIQAYDLGGAGSTLYDFIWDEFCDWYVEVAKLRLYGEDKRARRTAQYVLWEVLERTLRLLHPFMPFISEEIWQHLPHAGESIVVAPWPAALVARDEAAERDFGLLQQLIRGIRNARAEMEVPPSRKARVIIQADDQAAAALEAGRAYLEALAAAGEVAVGPVSEKKPARAVSVIASGVEAYLPLADLVDIEKEKARLAKEIATMEAEVARSERLLSNPGFVNKAPAEVVAKEREKEAGYRDKLARLKLRLSQLEA
ncbi:MAG TPA: valine--tRNA ligase [Firmicutes bacterium]|nr:valine--tRNA ligase [Bacillota bacterium]